MIPMRPLARTWPALFAWGAGLVHIALAAQIARSASAAAVAVIVALLAQGAGELVWGGLSLHAGQPVAARTAMTGGMTGAVLAGVAIGAGGSPVAAAAAVALLVPGAILAARSGRGLMTPASGWVPMVGLIAGAGIVAGLVTPALSTTAGIPEHGRIVFVDPHAGH